MAKIDRNQVLEPKLNHQGLDGLLLDQFPPSIKRRVKDRPDAFLRIAALDDEALDALIPGIDQD